MRVFVLGAGVSKTVGYPLGSELFGDIDKYVSECGRLINRFDYAKDWPWLCRRLRESKNTLIREAYHRRQLEHLFTILDLVSVTHTEALLGVFYSSKLGAEAVTAAESHYKKVDQLTKQYISYRQILLWALEAYFQNKHHYDREQFDQTQWDDLKTFGHKLSPGDVVITFNYDSTLERVLLCQGKWSPRNGYGFDIVCQRSAYDNTPVHLDESAITILHLHGSIGWYRKPSMREEYIRDGQAGAVPREAFGPASLETKASLDSIFLRDLGLNAVDAMLPRSPPQDPQLLLHPSFFKDYEMEGGNTLFVGLWRKAAEALRQAGEIVMIGYSLPPADSAALTLLLTNSERSKVEIVNSDTSANWRLRRLLSSSPLQARQSFQECLSRTPDCST